MPASILTDAEFHEWQYKTDFRGLLLQLTKPSTETVTQGIWLWERETDYGFVTKAIEPAGARTYSNSSLSDLGQLETSYHYDAKNRLKEVHYPDGTSEQWLDFDVNHNAQTYIGRDGITHSYEYDESRNLISDSITSSQLGLTQTTRYEYSPSPRGIHQLPAGLLLASTVAYGTADAVRTQTSYYLSGPAVGLPRRTTVAAGTSDASTTTYVYDSYGYLSKRTDGSNRTYSYSYDRLGRLLATSAPSINGSTAVTHYSYDAHGNLVSLIDPLNAEVVWDYNPQDQVVAEYSQYFDDYQQSHVAISTTKYTYDHRGNLTSITGPGGEVTAFTYDSRNQRKQKAQLAGVDPELQARAAEFGIAYFGASANTNYRYDQLGRLIFQSEETQGQSSTIGQDFAYNEVGQILWQSVLGDANTGTAYEYKNSRLDKVKTSTVTGKLEESYLYDDLGRLHVHSTPFGVTTYEDFDFRNNSKTEKLSGGDTTRVINYTYDRQDRVTSVTSPKSNTGRYVKTTNRYSPTGEVLSTAEAEYDQLGNNSVNRITRFEYDGRGRLVEKTLPAVNGHTAVTESYRYDDNDNTTQVTTNYIQDGALKTTSRYFGFDQQGRTLWEKADADQNGNPEFNSYHFDASGNLIATTGRASASDGYVSHSQTFTYDLRGNRVRAFTFSENEQIEEVNQFYDAANRTTGTINPTTNQIETFEYDSKGRLASQTSRYLNTILSQESYSYYESTSHVNVHETLSGSTSYQYDSRGLVSRETTTETTGTPGTSVSYYYDGLGERRSIINSTGATTTILRDAQGNITSQISDGTRNFDFDGFGQVIRSVDRNGRVVTYERDSSGLVRVERWYDSTTSKTPTYEAHYEYDALGRVLTISDSESNFTYSYDQLGNVSQVLAGYTELNRSFAVQTQTAFDGKIIRERLAEQNGEFDYLNEYLFTADGRLLLENRTNNLTKSKKGIEYVYEANRVTATKSFSPGSNVPFMVADLSRSSVDNRLQSLDVNLGGQQLWKEDYSYFDDGRLQTQTSKGWRSSRSYDSTLDDIRGLPDVSPGTEGGVYSFYNQSKVVPAAIGYATAYLADFSGLDQGDYKIVGQLEFNGQFTLGGTVELTLVQGGETVGHVTKVLENDADGVLEINSWEFTVQQQGTGTIYAYLTYTSAYKTSYTIRGGSLSFSKKIAATDSFNKFPTVSQTFNLNEYAPAASSSLLPNYGKASHIGGVDYAYDGEGNVVEAYIPGDLSQLFNVTDNFYFYQGTVNSWNQLHEGKWRVFGQILSPVAVQPGSVVELSIGRDGVTTDTTLASQVFVKPEDSNVNQVNFDMTFELSENILAGESFWVRLKINGAEVDVDGGKLQLQEKVKHTYQWNHRNQLTQLTKRIWKGNYDTATGASDGTGGFQNSVVHYSYDALGNLIGEQWQNEFGDVDKRYYLTVGGKRLAIYQKAPGESSTELQATLWYSRNGQQLAVESKTGNTTTDVWLIRNSQGTVKYMFAPDVGSYGANIDGKVLDVVYDQFGGSPSIGFSTDVFSNISHYAQLFNGYDANPRFAIYQHNGRFYSSELNRYLTQDDIGVYSGRLDLYGREAYAPSGTLRPVTGFNTDFYGTPSVWDQHWLDGVHAALDVVGVIPGVGIVSDLANAGIYLVEGRFQEASISGIAAIPGLGYSVAALQAGKYGAKFGRLAAASTKVLGTGGNILKYTKRLETAINLGQVGIGAYSSVQDIRTHGFDYSNVLQLGASALGATQMGVSLTRAKWAKQSTKAQHVADSVQDVSGAAAEIPIAVTRGRDLPIIYDGCFAPDTLIHAIVPVSCLATSIQSLHRANSLDQTIAADRCATTIQDIPLGSRVPDSNPRPEDLDLSLPEVDPGTWRQIDLTVNRKNGGTTHVQLLRPVQWLEMYDLEVGSRFDLQFSEFETEGFASVLSIKPCCEIASGKGNVVTGKFLTQNVGNLIEITLENGTQFVGTASHPVWSPDLADWVPLGDLLEGMHLQTLDGNVPIKSAVALPYTSDVFNIEVHSQHVYRVTLDGVLVHNNNPLNYNVTNAPTRAFAQRVSDAESLISRHAIDMTNAPVKSATNALGFQRNGPWFWRQLRNQKPEMFSPANLRRIKQGRSPLVDETWLKHNPQHAGYLDDKLIHHHIDQGRMASGLPETIHQELFDLLHRRTLD